MIGIIGEFSSFGWSEGYPRRVSARHAGDPNSCGSQAGRLRGGNHSRAGDDTHLVPPAQYATQLDHGGRNGTAA